MVLDQLRQYKQIRDQAMALQRELAAEKIEIEEGGVKVVVTADQRIESLVVEGVDQSRVADVINKALKKAQQVAAQKMMSMKGGLGGLIR